MNKNIYQPKLKRTEAYHKRAEILMYWQLSYVDLFHVTLLSGRYAVEGRQ